MSATTMMGFLGPNSITHAEHALGMRNITRAGHPATEADDPAQCTQWLTPDKEQALNHRLHRGMRGGR